MNYNKYDKVPYRTTRRLLRTSPVLLTHEAMQRELSELEMEMERLRKALENQLEGQLLVSGTESVPKYYLKTEAGRQFLPRSRIEEAAIYAQQDYYRSLLELLEERYSKLSDALQCLKALDPAQVFDNLSVRRKPLVIPEFLPDEEFAELWAATRYEGKKFRDDMPEYYTARGERVRSKSESDIADRNYYRGVLYLYEYPWTLETGGVWFPDFTVVNRRTRRVYIWEHFGKESDPQYAISSMRKLRLYQENGIWPGENLILTHETADRPLTIRDIDAVIDHYLV